MELKLFLYIILSDNYGRISDNYGRIKSIFENFFFTKEHINIYAFVYIDLTTARQ